MSTSELTDSLGFCWCLGFLGISYMLSLDGQSWGNTYTYGALFVCFCCSVTLPIPGEQRSGVQDRIWRCGESCLSVLCSLLCGLSLCRESLQSHWAEQAEPMKQETQRSVRGRGGTGTEGPIGSCATGSNFLNLLGSHLVHM